MRRVEDPPFLRGTRPYTDDLREPGALYAVFIRSGFAHATILGIDTSEAAAAPGVVGVYTAADLEPQAVRHRRPSGRHARGDAPRGARHRQGALHRRARRGPRGRDAEQAVDASELVEVDFEPLDVLVDMTKALDADAPQLFASGNLAAAGPTGEDALADAEVRTGARFVNQRLAAVPMEPSAALAVPDPDTGGFILYTPSQGPHAYQGAICASTGIEKEQLRVVSTATGGGFGARIACYPEQVVVVELARRLGKAVRYIETRSRTMIETRHGRAWMSKMVVQRATPRITGYVRQGRPRAMPTPR